MRALRILLKKDLYVARNLNKLAVKQSKFKAAFILVFTLSLLVGLMFLFLSGFRFLNALGGIGLMIVRHLFSIFFFGLGIMLILSNIITSYTTIFRSDEIPFLVLHPVPYGELIVHKLIETALFSSWAFFLMIVPFVSAYAWHESLSPFFVLWTFLYSIPFVSLCAVIGTATTLLAVRWMPHFRPTIWCSVFVLLAISLFFFTPAPERARDDISFVMARFVPGMRIASFPLSPSWWVAEGIMSLSRGQWARSGLFMGLLVSNVLFLILVVERLGNASFYPAWQKVLVSRKRKRVLPNTVLFGIRALPFTRSVAAAIALKDIRSLLRDPVQWSQGLLFFGLLGLYFFNLRNLHYHLLMPVWRNLIAFLNIFSLSAVMCSFCSRFIYPQLSLEGQGFWILGMSPVSMGRVLKIKFITALAGMLTISIGLTGISMLMLNVEPRVMFSALLISAAMSFALCGLAIGLGATFLDLKQRNPAAIISGFGGTLNLVLSLLFMILAILPFGMLFHSYYSEQITVEGLHRFMVLATAWLLIITGITTATPLFIGKRSLINRDY